MKKKVFFIFLIFFLLVSVKTTWGEEAAVQDSTEEAGIETLYNYITKIKNEYEIFRDFDAKTYVDNFTKGGSNNLNSSKIIQGVLSIIFKEVVICLKMMGIVIVIAVICALLKNLQSAFNNEQLSSIAYFACFSLLIIILSKNFIIAIDMIKSTIHSLSNFMAALVPIIMLLLTTVGGLAQVSTMDPIILTAVNLGPRIYIDIIIPLILMSFMLQFANNISDNYKISNLTKLLKQTVLWIQGILVTIFIGILTIRGMASSTLDAVTAKTAKFAIDNFIPIVGKALSDAVATVAGYSLILKNALSTLGLIIIIGIVIIPILKIFVMAMMYKLTGALLEPICDNKIVNCISSIGESLILIMSCVISISVMFFVMIAIMSSAGKYILGAG